MDLNKVSRFLSLILRHHPEKIGITLDKHGWASVAELLAGMSKTYPIDMDILEKSLGQIISSDIHSMEIRL